MKTRCIDTGLEKNNDSLLKISLKCFQKVHKKRNIFFRNSCINLRKLLFSISKNEKTIFESRLAVFLHYVF